MNPEPNPLAKLSKLIYNTRMKTCSRCHLERPDTDFHRAPNTRDKLSTVCKLCKKEYNAARYSAMTPEQRLAINSYQRGRYESQYGTEMRVLQQRQYSRKKSIVRNIKSSHGCLRCGESDPYALDFHHVAEKTRDIGKGSTVKDSVISDEIKKCIVLCANCHRKLHSGSWQLSDLYTQMESEYPEAYELLNQS